MRTPFVVGNWKLNKTIAEALALVTELKNQLGAVRGVAVGVAPPYTALHSVAKRLEGSAIATCAQDCFWETVGRVHRRGLAAAARRRRRDVGDRRPQRAPPVLRRHQRVGRQEGARGARGRARRDRVRRRDCSPSAMPAARSTSSTASSPARSTASTPRPPRSAWSSPTSRSGRSAPAAPRPRRRPRRSTRTSASGSPSASAPRPPHAIRIQYGGSVKPSNAEALHGRGRHRRRAGRRCLARSR